MTEKVPSFTWSCDNGKKVFPIDYTLAELVTELLGFPKTEAVTQAEPETREDNTETENKPALNVKKVRKFLKAGYFPSKPLYQLLASKGSPPSRTPKETPPIPIETLDFIKCLFELSEDPEYAGEFQNAVPAFHQPIPSYIIKEYLTRLCHRLCENSTNNGNASSSPGCTFSRHMAFQNDTFKQVILEELWEREVTPRFNKLKELAQHVSLDCQMESLKDCLLTLDRNILNLSAMPQLTAENCSPSEEVIGQLMQQLLSERHRDHTRKSAVYKVDNLSIHSSTMKEIFDKLQSPSSRGSIDPQLLSQARNTYLSHLNQKIEAQKNKGSVNALAFEKNYLNLCAYLGLSEFDISEDLHSYIWEQCKTNFSCAFGLFADSSEEYSLSSLQPIANGNEKGYVGILIEQQILYWTQKYLQVYEEPMMFAQSLYMGMSVSFNDLGNYQVKVPDAEKDRLNREPQRVDSIDYVMAANFRKYFQYLWNILSSEDSSIYDHDSHQFLSTKQVSTKLWRDGKKASHTFPKHPFPFSSRFEVENALMCYNLIVTHPKDCYHPKFGVIAFYKLIVTMLVLALHKAAQDVACSTEEFIQSLPKFIKEFHQISNEIKAESNRSTTQKL